MKSKIFLSMLVIIVAVSLVAGGTMAWFTDADSINSNTFTTGILNVDLNQDTRTIQLGDVSKMAPGDVMTTPATIEIKNNGNKNLGWFGKLGFVGDDNFKDMIYIDNMKMEFLAPDGVSIWEPMDNFIQNGVFTGAAQTPENVITLRKWMGSNDMNAFGYENMGALVPGYKYRLTFTLGLSKLANNYYMNKTVNLSYSVIATQLTAEALNILLPGSSTHLDWFDIQIKKQP